MDARLADADFLGQVGVAEGRVTDAAHQFFGFDNQLGAGRGAHPLSLSPALPGPKRIAAQLTQWA